jgi:DNA (cytosine-5)-methyltransferase 1
MPRHVFTTIDLFAGCGGLSLGLSRAGFRSLFAVEKHPDAFATLEANLADHFDWPVWLARQPWDIRRILRKHRDDLSALRPRVDLLVGGPPCQGFSTAGHRKYGDSRNKLITAYIDAVEALQPRALLIENVRGFSSKYANVQAEAYSEVVVSALRKLGYSDACGKLFDLSQFGVPQRRHRYIVVASREGLASSFLENLEEKATSRLRTWGLPSRISAGMALSDLQISHGTVESVDFPGFHTGLPGPMRSAFQKWARTGWRPHSASNSHRFVNHDARTIRVFKRMLAAAPRNRCIMLDERKRYKLRKRNATVLSRTKPAPTVTSIPDDLIHYAEPRVLTVRECARLQTFPDNFQFCGPYTTGGRRRRFQLPRYTQVANAVPPLFAEQIGIAWDDVFRNA